jgi:hypothetical protein
MSKMVTVNAVFTSITASGVNNILFASRYQAPVSNWQAAVSATIYRPVARTHALLFAWQCFCKMITRGAAGSRMEEVRAAQGPGIKTIWRWN